MGIPSLFEKLLSKKWKINKNLFQRALLLNLCNQENRIRLMLRII
jgi:hypothetical protein